MIGRSNVQSTTKTSVNAMNSGVLDRKCHCGNHSTGGECARCSAMQGVLQRKPLLGESTPAVPRIVYDVLTSPGRPLERPTQGLMERHFQRDFSAVRIHTDATAVESAQAVNARAYTVERHVVFGAGGHLPDTSKGRHLLAHELSHVVQQRAAEPSGQLTIGDNHAPQERGAEAQAQRAMAMRGTDAIENDPEGVVLRRAANERPVETTFDDCNETLQRDLEAKHQPAMARVGNAIDSLAPGWKRMDEGNRAVFRQLFDPADSGDVDEAFVRDVRGNFQKVQSYMRSLHFDCNQDSKNLCGSAHGWCTGQRLMWTCFGNLHVCPRYASEPLESRKIETVIHESTHNALHTTDREYVGDSGFSRLRPRGGGSFGAAILSFLGKLPVIGTLFRFIPANSDTLYNPDSYASYAMEAEPHTP